MAASMVEGTSSYFGIVLSVLTFFAIYSVDLCKSAEKFTSFEDSYQFQSLFSALLTELHGYETNIHRCMFLANRSQINVGPSQCLSSQVDSQTYFTFPIVSKALDSWCSAEDIYPCMQSDPFVKEVVGILEEDISKTVDDVCCFLAQCRNCKIGIREIEDNHATVPTKGISSNGDCYDGCMNCSKLLGINETNIFRRTNILQNMTCTNKTFNNFPCTELNIIALNVLSTQTSSKLLEDAKDMIKHCNPGFFADPARTLSAMITTPTDDEISNLENFFSSDTVRTEPLLPKVVMQQPKIQKGPGKIIGVIFLVIIVIVSLFIMGWLIRTRICNSHSMTTNYSNVLYSRIDYDHENLDDYSDDDDDKGELSMFERA